MRIQFDYTDQKGNFSYCRQGTLISVGRTKRQHPCLVVDEDETGVAKTFLLAGVHNLVTTSAPVEERTFASDRDELLAGLSDISLKMEDLNMRLFQLAQLGGRLARNLEESERANFRMEKP